MANVVNAVENTAEVVNAVAPEAEKLIEEGAKVAIKLTKEGKVFVVIGGLVIAVGSFFAAKALIKLFKTKKAAKKEAAETEEAEVVETEEDEKSEEDTEE